MRRKKSVNFEHYTLHIMGEGELEENTINHLKESEEDEEDDGRRVHQVRVLVLGLLYCTVLYCTVLYCTVLYCTVLYCTVLYTHPLRHLVCLCLPVVVVEDEDGGDNTGRHHEHDRVEICG